MSPKRIQLRRTKGWRKPEGAIVVARPTRWGNPFKVGGPRPPWQQRYGRGTIESIEEAIYHFSFYARLVHFVPVDPKAKPYRGIYTPGLGIELLSAHARRLLAGHDLACWCPLDQPCHADVLLELANPSSDCVRGFPEGTGRSGGSAALGATIGTNEGPQQ